MNGTASPDPAKARFFIIQLVRLGGMALTVFGLAIMAGRIALPPPLGLALSAIGLFEALFVPIILARRWKTPRS